MQPDFWAETQPKPDIHDASMKALAFAVAEHLGPILLEKLKVDLALGDDAVFTPEEASHIIRRSPSTLEAWRASGIGPRSVKLGPRAIGYRLADLRDYVRTAEKFFPDNSTTRKAAPTAC